MASRPLTRAELIALLDHFAGSPYRDRLEQIAAHDAAQREIIATQAREIARLAAPSQAYLDDEEERGYAVPSPLWGTPAHAPDAVREAAERADKAMRDVFGGVDRFGDYCGHPVMPGKLAHAVQELLAALRGALAGAAYAVAICGIGGWR